MKPLQYAILAAISIMAWSCKNDDEPASRIPTNACYDFATLESKGENGSVFTLRKDGDSPLITYKSSYAFAKDTILGIGDRLIISYLPIDRQPYSNGEITLYGYRYLDNQCQQALPQLPDTVPGYKIDPMKITAINRDGNYINVQSQLSCLKAKLPHTLLMVADPTTEGQDYPALFIVYQAADPGENSFTSYASYDISDVWNQPTTQGVVVMAYSGQGFDTYKFEKQSINQ